MTPFQILDHIILKRKIYIIYIIISLIIAFPMFTFFKQIENNKPNYSSYITIVNINTDIKNLIANNYKIKENLELVFSFYDNNTNLDGVLDFDATNNFINRYSENVDFESLDTFKDTYNEVLLTFLRKVSSATTQNKTAYDYFYNKINENFLDDELTEEAIYAMLKSTNMSALNDEFDLNFNDIYKNVKLNSYFTMKSKGFDYLGDSYFNYTEALLEEASREVHSILIEKTFTEYADFIQEQQLKINSLIKYKEDLPFKYFEGLNLEKEFLVAKLNVAEALGIDEPTIGGAGVGNSGVVMNYPSIDKIFMGSTVIKLEISEIDKKIALANEPEFKSRQEILIEKDIKNNIDHLLISKAKLDDRLDVLQQLSVDFYSIEKKHIEFMGSEKSNFLIIVNIFIIQVFFLMLLFFLLVLSERYKQYRVKL